MKTENNGKIAIAIVAMFVVALSVVGFTYAYFTAQVKGNNEKSVTTTAGKLAIKYQNGTDIVGNNVVPGWLSDGNHYYDTEGSKYIATKGATPDKDVIGVEAITKAECVDGKVTKANHTVSSAEGAEFNTCDTALQTAANGITDPTTFTITNESTDNHAAEYMISIKSTENGFSAGSIKAYLYAGTSDTDKTISAEKLIATVELGATGATVPFLKEADIATKATITDTAKYYFVVLEYPNSGANQDDDKGKTVKATVVVNGIAKGTDGKYYDDNNALVQFAA